MEKIKSYRLELDAERHPALVAEDKWEYEQKRFSSPQEIVDLLNLTVNLKNQAEEYVYMLALDIRLNLKGLFEVSHGASAYTPCDPKEIYTRALLSGANRIVVVHNHPTGDPTPSEVDTKTAERLKSTGEVVGIPLKDFIIIGDDTYYSFKENME